MNENPLSKGTFISSFENLRRSDIYINEIQSNIDYNLNDNFNYNKIELSEKTQILILWILKNKMMIFLKNYYFKSLQMNVMMNKKIIYVWIYWLYPFR